MDYHVSIVAQQLHQKKNLEAVRHSCFGGLGQGGQQDVGRRRFKASDFVKDIIFTIKSCPLSPSSIKSLCPATSLKY
jgi:hypothetical protein